VSVIYRSKNGTILTQRDLANAKGVVNWEIPSQIPVSAEARDLHQRGREAGARGDKDGALALLERAAQLAPQWPYPVYDAAFTNLLKGDSEEALRLYRRTIELAPRGFFTAFTAVYYLNLESEGQLAKGTYLAYVSLEWVDSPTERSQRVDALARLTPTFAPIWKEKALLTEAPAERLALIDRGLKLDPDRESFGFLLINKALTLSELGRPNEAVPILGELGTDQSQPLDVQQIALSTLAGITSK
jgi:tetratricopeptide (TPR) repeat protein